jgi:hypothetical protein
MAEDKWIEVRQTIDGLTFEDAKEKLLALDWKMRIVKKDGQATVVTRDVKLDRINVRVENGIVYFESVG